MHLGLTDKIALVLGASHGIGAATAQLLAEEGAHVIVGFGHDELAARDVARQVEACGRRAWLHQLDLSRPAAVTAAAEQLIAQHARLDVVILCAGQNILTPWPELRPPEWEQIMNVNLNGAFFALQALAPRVSAGGAIVTVASVAAETGAPHHAHYAAAKAGLVNLTKTLARALAPQVRVNCVSPGVTLTAMGEATLAALEPDYARKKIPLQRYAQPEEIARCIIFAASPMASFMTGATLDVNGGRDMR